MSIDTSASISDADYEKHVDMVMDMLGGRHARGEEVVAADCVIGLEHGRPANRKIRDFILKMKLVKASEFDAALRNEVATRAGFTAHTPREFVGQIAEKMNITATFSGLLNKRETPYIEFDGKRDYISPDLWDTYEFKTLIATRFHCNIGFDDFARAVRMTAVEYGLPFKAADLNDASEDWYAKTCNDRLWQISGGIDYTDNKSIRERGQASLRKLAEACFDCPNGVDFVMAVFNKFIWQVKRKIDRMPVTDHLMPVILGAQGTGKSTLIRQMLKPINELWVPSDFKQITDDRNTMLWKNYAIFLDEMGWASKSDMDTVKNIITADTLNRRIMQTTKYNVVAQNATFIGAANANELADLIRDVSGTRRFVSLNMKTQADWQLINAIDWQEVWQSVDHAACDPMAGFRGVLGAVQEADRTKTPVESWLDSLNPKTSLTGAMQVYERKFTSSELYLDFSEYEQTYFRAFKPSTLIGFGREMKRRCADETGRFIRSEKDNMAVFQWRDSKLTKIAPNLRLVTGTDD